MLLKSCNRYHHKRPSEIFISHYHFLKLCHSPEAFFNVLKSVPLPICRHQVLSNSFVGHHQVQGLAWVKVLNGKPGRLPRSDNILVATSEFPIITLINKTKTLDFFISNFLSSIVYETNETTNKFHGIITLIQFCFREIQVTGKQTHILILIPMQRYMSV